VQNNVQKRIFGFFGLDLDNGSIRDSVEAGVIEPTASKLKMIQFSTEAAITIIRIDDLIMLGDQKNS